MIKFNIHWFETCCDFEKFAVELIDDAEGTPGSSRQYTRFNSKVKPEIRLKKLDTEYDEDYL